MKTKMYKAVIINKTTGDCPVILEQERLCLGNDFLQNAIAWAFMESCEGGIDARHIAIYVSADEKPICTYRLINGMDGSTVWAKLFLHREGEKPVMLRRMIIAD